MSREKQTRLDFLTDNLGAFGAPVKDAGRDIWLAGLGALSIARKQGGRFAAQGSQIFEELVSQGRKFENRVARTARKEAASAADRASEIASKAGRALHAESLIYHLLPFDKDWVVRLEGSDENLSQNDTKDSAIEAARGIARAHEPSRLVVHRGDGTVQTSYTYGQ